MEEEMIVTIPACELAPMLDAVSEAYAYFEQADTGILIATADQISAIRRKLSHALAVLENS